VKAVVLVGGFGTRLRPLTLTTPKQMLPVIDTTMLEHVIGGLDTHGVDEVVLSLGYKEDVFREAYPDGECAGVPLTYAVEPEPLDTAGAVRFAAEWAGIDETFIVVNGDVFTDRVDPSGRSKSVRRGADRSRWQGPRVRGEASA
jgi:mannose-1-phosphate guanylyltransferase